MSEPMETLLSIDIARSDGEMTVTLAGELDLMSTEALTARLSGVAPTRRTVLDMRAVTFMDSTALRAMWLLRQECLSSGSKLLLRSPSVAVARLLDLTGLARSFEYDEVP